MKKLKWIIPVIFVLIILFAPFPFPHFTEFSTVYNFEGKEEDVTLKVRFFHLKPLFFQYGDRFEGYFSLGSVKIYDNETNEKIYDLKLSFNVSKDPDIDDVYFVMSKELNQYNHNQEHMEFIDCNGYLIWDDTCQNIIVPLDIRTETFGDNGTITDRRVTYFSSQEGLDADEMKAEFEKFEGFFLPSSIEMRQEPMR